MTFVPNTEWLIEVAKGKIAGHTLIPVIGRSEFVVSAQFDDIWDVGGLQTVDTVAQTYEIVSTSASDTAAGIGARVVVVASLDANFDAQITLVVMNGTTAVTLSNTHIRPRLAIVFTAGSNNTNVGDISVRIDGGSTTQTDQRIRILADAGTSNNSQFTVPAGKSILNLQIALFAPKGEDAIVRTRSTPPTTDAAEFSPGEFPIYQTINVFPVTAGNLIGEKSDIKVQAKSTNENITITSNFSILQIDNTAL